jgi:hypothetical protein
MMGAEKLSSSTRRTCFLIDFSPPSSHLINDIHSNTYSCYYFTMVSLPLPQWLNFPILLIFCVVLTTCSASSGSIYSSSTITTTNSRSSTITNRNGNNPYAPWQQDASESSSRSSRDARRKQWQALLPVHAFARHGRVPSVEAALQLVSSPSLDPTANLVLALPCRDGIVIVSTRAQSPTVTVTLLPPHHNNSHNNNNNNTTKNTDTDKLLSSEPLFLESSIPMIPLYPPNTGWMTRTSRRKTNTTTIHNHSDTAKATAAAEGGNLVAITAGNAMHSHVLRRRIQAQAQAMARRQELDATATTTSRSHVLARRLADQVQTATQSTTGGRLLVVRTYLPYLSSHATLSVLVLFVWGGYSRIV